MRRSTLFLLTCLLIAGPLAAQPASSATRLPPALQAAVSSGNGKAVQQAIATLSAGNPAQMAALSAQVAAAAEHLAATNPQAALQAATAAVESIRSANVFAAAPQQAEAVLASVGRIINSPAVLRSNPEAAAQLGATALAVAKISNNPNLISSVAAQASAAADQLASIDPRSAGSLKATIQAVATKPFASPRILHLPIDPTINVSPSS